MAQTDRTVGTLVGLTVLGMAAICFIAGATLHDAAPPHMQPLDQPALRVMTFNIRVDSAEDGENSWSHRRVMVASVIRFHQADIAGLQESYDHQVTELEERLPGYTRVGPANTLNPILVRDSRIEVQHEEVFWLSETPEIESTGWDASTTRTVLYTILRERRTHTELHVFNTHFDHRGQQAKAHSAMLLAEKINALPAGARVILLGDLNSVEESEPIEIIEDRTTLRDAYHLSATGNHGPTGTFRGFKENRWTGRRLDHIYVRHLIVQQHGILADSYDDKAPSDHYPVLAELVLD
jgi:endonuclease/exonuclease/phosphatase family metal-dependent hydrolase